MATKKKPAVDPATFLLQACPRVLRAMRSTVTELGGRYGVVVDGTPYLIDFTTQQVTSGSTAGADVVVTMDAARFGSLATGRVELRSLVRDGVVKADGDVSKLENLALILAFLERG
jgi:hypothetical protein